MNPAVRAPGLWGQGSPLDIQQGAQEEASKAPKKKHWAPGWGAGGGVSELWEGGRSSPTKGCFQKSKSISPPCHTCSQGEELEAARGWLF